ncbi:hypothetical protein GPECTOR_17g826 [Gonium pectorale]|uniref:Uncharacterized protein n=1 Tax=Gonium pectorale TaxID=33097 RepID=A0A150GK22_GONPE|nr:hypothetical protein GPECTOR_17g826 [Gonium pectorale]|eukprot:KXZ50189.1 hypothetical protein GPECTOR_17g826 [Gonium pectorale]
MEATRTSAALTAQLNETIDSLQQQLASSEVVLLAAELDQREQEVARLAQQVNDLQLAAQEHEEENQRLRQRLLDEARAVEQQHAQQLQRYESLDRRFASLTQEHALLVQQNADLAEQGEACAERARQQHAAAGQARRDLEAQVASLTAEVARLTGKLASAHHQHQEARRDVDAVKIDLQMKERRLNQATEHKVDLEAKIAELEGHLDAFLSHDLDLGYARKHMPVVDAAMACLEARLGEAEDARDAARIEALQVRAAYRAKWRARMDAKQELIASQASQIRALQARLATVEAHGLAGSPAAACSSSSPAEGPIAISAATGAVPLRLTQIRACVEQGQGQPRFLSEAGFSDAAPCSGPPSGSFDRLASDSSASNLGSDASEEDLGMEPSATSLGGAWEALGPSVDETGAALELTCLGA